MTWMGWLYAVVTLATAVAGLATAIVNGLRWRQHARDDDRRFADVREKIDGDGRRSS